ncbi:MAG: tRNA epoxyqueuosine(34) reductase QueG [Candidatus Binatia bacterium]
MITADKEALRQQAIDLGFHACGFTTAEPLACGSLLREWNAQGRHGSMDYLAGDPAVRLDPGRRLAGARSVVVALWRYLPPPAVRMDWKRTLVGRIAAYALGPDYHEHLGDRMRDLGEAVARSYGARYSTHVDAGPLVEKELARRAGLGWYGRNTNILSTDAGSYFLIACLVTDASIPPDAPMTTDHCGSCTACIPACPTGALDAGPTIDATRCISYLTIEHRGPVDVALRPRLENWVFGCDVCQEVCPWHGRDDAAATGEAEDPLYPALPGLLELDEGGFHERYRHTAVWRAKRRGLARNAALALGNSGNPAAIAPLARALLEHDEPLVRAHAAWALGRLNGPEAARTLAAASRRERIAPVREEIAAARAGGDPPERASYRPR